ncbi:MAG: hypothetical protein QGI10_07215 [Vicinamibacterales bacterium]|nr:hypothetical protein [Vicinamibacterales bacterium]MDP7690979.1 hypothetical protein [Vicinamibacterales bacterium]HJN43716.1 hypothetical protein [Vicinamibacterales bacterium]
MLNSEDAGGVEGQIRQQDRLHGVVGQRDLLPPVRLVVGHVHFKLLDDRVQDPVFRHAVAREHLHLLSAVGCDR